MDEKENITDRLWTLKITSYINQRTNGDAKEHTKQQIKRWTDLEMDEFRQSGSTKNYRTEINKSIA
eukprot:scaffold191747_cov33-Prasinocladus_malaysianus.AAC.1